MEVVIEFFPESMLDNLKKAVDESGDIKIIENRPSSIPFTYLKLEVPDMFSFLILGHRMGLNIASEALCKSLPSIVEKKLEESDSLYNPSTN